MASQIQRHPEAFSLDGRTRQKQSRQHASLHLQFIREQRCLVTGVYGCEAAHIRFADPRYFKRGVGMAEKPDDKWTVPLSPEQHRKQHTMDERQFWAEAGIDPLYVAQQLWTHTGNDEIAEEIIRLARAGATP